MKKKAILKIPPIPTEYRERGKCYSVSAGVAVIWLIQKIHMIL